jgi:hypothetical protein
MTDLTTRNSAQFIKFMPEFAMIQGNKFYAKDESELLELSKRDSI